MSDKYMRLCACAIVANVLQARRSVSRTQDSCTSSEALNYEPEQTHAWILQDIHVHPEPFEGVFEWLLNWFRSFADPGLWVLGLGLRLGHDVGLSKVLVLEYKRPDALV